MNTQKRIVASCLIGVAVATAFLILLPRNGLLIAAYLFTVLAIVIFGASLWRVAADGRRKYLTNTALPLLASGYLTGTAALGIIFVILQLSGVYAIGVIWFLLLELLLLAIFGLRVMALNVGKELIEQTGETVENATAQWKEIHLEVGKLLAAAPENVRPSIAKLEAAIRCADPVSAPEAAEVERKILAALTGLEAKVVAAQVEEVETLCNELATMVDQRGLELKRAKRG